MVCGVWCVVCGVWCVVCGVVWCGVGRERERRWCGRSVDDMCGSISHHVSASN